MKTYYAKCLNCDNNVHVTNKKRPQRFCSHNCYMEFNKDVSYVGFKVNYLEVIGDDIPRYNKKGHPIRMVKCLCVCGRFSIKTLTSVKTGLAKSCGCFSKEYIKKAQFSNIKHGLCRHPLYIAWIAMRQRCYNVNYIGYKYYGGRGVIVCDEWNNSFNCFYEWGISHGWQKGLHLDKDIKGNGLVYSPETCCFVTKSDNGKKTRKIRYILLDGVETSLSDLSKRFYLKRYVIIKRLKLGWDLNKTLTTPVKGIL